MKYTINLGNWGSIFAVPSSVVDEHLKTANPIYLKILLFMLRHSDNKELDAGMIAKGIGAEVCDICDGITYWIAAGILKLDGDGFAPSEAKKERNEVKIDGNISEKNSDEEVKSSENEKKPEKRFTPVSSLPRPTHAECAELLSNSNDLRSLIEEAQNALGKLLSRSEVDTLVSLNTWAGMPIDVILMAIYYCVGIDKKNMRYIEKVVLNWADLEIDTARKADEHLKSISQKNSAWKRVSSVVGISDRKPSSKEEEICNRWVNIWNFDESIINYAFECCVNNTGKLSFNYMDKVLESWNGAGITTAEDAKAYTLPASKKNSKKVPEKRVSDSSYDLDSIQKRLDTDLLG